MLWEILLILLLVLANGLFAAAEIAIIAARRGRLEQRAADGSRAAAEYVVLGTYLATDEGLPEAHGQTYRLPGGAFFDICDGKVARVTNYYNLEDRLRQVGA